MNESTPLYELEKLSHFLHGAHSVCDHENASATFHQAKHMLDEIITKIKVNMPHQWVVPKDPLKGFDLK